MNLMKLVLLGLTALLPLTAQAPETFTRRTPAVVAVEKVGPAVVNIRTQSFVRRNHLFGGLFQTPDEGMLADRSLGSGVILHPRGYCLTNEHVVHGASRIFVTLQGGREVAADLLNFDKENDLAVLKLRGDGPFPTAPLGDSDDLLVGEPTIALGNPFGLSSSVTTGILSAKGRAVRFRGRSHFEDFIQTSALINPGNSGGPLLNVNGRVIGINVAIDSRAQGIGYAIPINRARDVLVDLLDPEIVRGVWLGLQLRDEAGGAVIHKIAPDGPAASIGLRPGDVLTKIDGQAVKNRLDAFVALLDRDVGSEIGLVARRGRGIQEARLKLTKLPLGHQVEGVLSVHGMECTDLTPRLGRRLGLPERMTSGVVVLTVQRDSLAAQLGVRSGDVVYQIGSYATKNVRSMARVLDYYERRRGEATLRVFRPASNERLRGTLYFD